MLLKRSPFLLVAVALLGFGLLSLFFRQEAESELEDLGPFYGDGAPSGGSFKILPDHLGQPPDDLGEGDDGADLPLADESGASSHRNMPTETPLPNLKSPSLRMRMQMFLARPLLSHSAALAHNVLTCPLEIHDRQVNPDQLRGELENWEKMDVTELRRRRSSLVSGLEELESRGTELVGGGLEGPVAGGGKGIVIAGGNRDTTARLLTLLRILRHHLESTIPVQVFHFPGEITDDGEREEIRKLGGELHAFEGVPQLDIWKNFQIKALAILSSTFDEVLYLDSDNIPLRDPASLFDNPLYVDGGRAVFWPDINKDHPANAIFRLLGEECRHDEWQIDSGQILIDKRGNGGLNLAALHLAALMQKDHEFWFKLSGGDKDTFRYAFHVLDIPFKPSPRWLSSAGSINSFDGRFCGNTMLQYDLPPNTGTPLFLHANLLKHTSGVSRGSTFSKIKSAPSPMADSPSLDSARMWVYDGPWRGMCVDLEMGEGAAKQAVVEDWDDVGVRGLEDWYYDEGGRGGGW